MIQHQLDYKNALTPICPICNEQTRVRNVFTAQWLHSHGIPEGNVGFCVCNMGHMSLLREGESIPREMSDYELRSIMQIGCLGENIRTNLRLTRLHHLPDFPAIDLVLANVGTSAMEPKEKAKQRSVDRIDFVGSWAWLVVIPAYLIWAAWKGWRNG